MTHSYPKPMSAGRALAKILWAKCFGKTGDHVFSFLKCDKVGCVHVEFHDELTPAHIGKPCPTCNRSLLTPEDFDKWERGKI